MNALLPWSLWRVGFVMLESGKGFLYYCFELLVDSASTPTLALA